MGQWVGEQTIFSFVRYTWMCFLIHFESIGTFSEWNLLNPVQYNVFFIWQILLNQSPPRCWHVNYTLLIVKAYFVVVLYFLFSCGTILRHHLSMNMLFYKRQVSNVYGHKPLLASVLLVLFFFVSDTFAESHFMMTGFIWCRTCS